MTDNRRNDFQLITGGGGYAGFNLGKKLSQQGYTVILFDIKEPLWSMLEGMVFHKGNITNLDELETAFKGVSCVYHLASYGMSGNEMFNKKLIEAVNISGTQNVIQACLTQNVCRLVYTSTNNVVFGTEEIINGDESLPYLPVSKFLDNYSKTKCLAEQKVLAANNLNTANGHKLYTCSLRLPGIYGPGEQRHLPRVMSYIERGLYVVTYGEETLQDFLHVDNLVQAHIKAGDALRPERSSVAAGQTYFISDGKPVNSVQFFNTLASELGYPEAKFRLPVKLVYFVAIVIELVYFLVSSLYNFQPLLTRTEVCKTGITHYFCITKARKDLGYCPTVQNDLTGVVKHFKMAGHMHQVKQTSLMYYLVNIIIAIIIASILLSFLPIAR
ncbi:hypothetical protein ScPMuIL_004114 [Solemya velum]